MQHVVAVTHLGGHRLRLRFEDGVEGVVDFTRILKFRGELVAPLRDPAYLAQAFVHPEARVVTWPNGMDVDNLVLYSYVTGRSIRSLLTGYKPPPPRKPAKRRAKRRTTASSR
jgi:hypothetical protein